MSETKIVSQVPEGARKLPDIGAAAEADVQATDSLKEAVAKAQNRSPNQGSSDLTSDNSVLIRLKTGMLVEIGPPAASTVFTATKIVAEHQSRTNEEHTATSVMLDTSVVRGLLYVRAVSGKALPVLTSMPEIQQLANALGDQGVGAVQTIVQKYWGAPNKPEDIEVIKKNLRDG